MIGPQPGHNPDKWPLEHISDIIPISIFAYPYVLLSTPLINALQSRLPLLIRIYNGCPSSIPLAPGHGYYIKNYILSNHINTQGRGFKGFRSLISIHLTEVELLLPTAIYGISNNAAIANVTGVNTRNIWHATQIISSVINRPRLSIEYMYIIGKV